MRVSYDPEKSARNEAERGLAFDLAEAFDWSTALIVEDTRKDYEEPRFQALGMIGRALAHVGLHAAQGWGACHQPAPCEPTRKDAPCRASQTLN